MRLRPSVYHLYVISLSFLYQILTFQQSVFVKNLKAFLEKCKMTKMKKMFLFRLS